MSSGLMNFEDVLPEAIHHSDSPFTYNIQASANTGSKIQAYNNYELKSENFVFSPDVAPSKQTKDMFVNFRFNTEECDNPFGLTSRQQSEA